MKRESPFNISAINTSNNLLLFVAGHKRQLILPSDKISYLFTTFILHCKGYLING